MTRSEFALAVTLLALAAPELPAQAQAPGMPAAVAPGDRVRVTASARTGLAGTAADSVPRTIVGRVVALEDSALVIAEADRAVVPVRVPLSAVRSIERSAGTSRANGTANGAVIGLAIGALLGYAGGDDCDGKGWICFDRGDTAMFGAVTGIGIGALVGLATGSRERWAPATLPGRVSLRPGARGSMAVSLAF